MYHSWWQKKRVYDITAMSLFFVGPVMFGGTDRIISYLLARKLLAANKNYARCTQYIV